MASKVFRNYILVSALSLAGSAHPAFTMLYGSDGNDVYRFSGDCSVANLRESCWNALIMFALTVQPNGDLTIASGTETLVKNGVYTGDPTWGPNVTLLKTQPTSVTRYELCLGGWGDTSFDNIRNLVASQGTGTGSILYRNFQALKNACPGLDAINDDDEGTYDLGSTVAFGWMLNALGMKLSQAPYTNQPFWVALKNNLGGVCDLIYLQCYQGGAGNNPAQWNAAYGNGVHVIPGQETNYPSQAQFANWAATSGATGGFFWPDWYWSPGTNWASLIAAGIGTNCGAAPAITPYLNVNGAGWQQTTTVTVPYNASVSLGPQSTQGGWSWTGPGGFSANGRQIDNIPLYVGTNTFVATNSTNCVCQNTVTFTIIMQGPPACTSSGSFGNNFAGTNGYNLAGQLDLSRMNLLQAMTVTSLQLYFGAGSSGLGVAGIYSDNAGSPGNLLVQSRPYPLSAGWDSFILPVTTLAAGNYWLGGSFTGNAVYEFSSSGSPGLNFMTYAYNGSLPNTVGATTGYGWSMCVYASGCLLPTPTPSRTPTPSKTATPTLSRSPTPTLTQTPTLTRSPTASMTLTQSPSPTLSQTPTPTPTLSKTTTPSLTASPTLSTSPSSSATPSLSPTSSASPTASRTVSESATPSASPSSTPTITPTPSWTPTLTSSGTLTLTPTPSLSCSPTPSFSSTLTFSVTVTPSRTRTETASPTLSCSPSQTFTALPSGSATPTPSPTLTQTPAVSSTATPSPPRRHQRGPVGILSVVPVPNPNPLSLSLQMEGDVDEVELRCYSKGLACVWQAKSGPLEQGWARVLIDRDNLRMMGSGLYYIRAVPQRGGVRGEARVAKMLRLE